MSKENSKSFFKYAFTYFLTRLFWVLFGSFLTIFSMVNDPDLFKPFLDQLSTLSSIQQSHEDHNDD